MRVRQLYAVIAVIAAFCLGMFGVVPAASAASASPEGAVILGAADEAEIRRNFDRLEIDRSDQRSLMAKIRRGELPDSTTGENEVASWSEERDGGTATVYEYADGSRRVVGIRPAESTSGVSVLVEHNCIEQEGAGYWPYGPCEIYASDPVIETGFTAAWHMSADHDVIPSRIVRAEGAYCSSVIATCTVSLDVNQYVPTEFEPARAVLTFSYAAVGGFAGASGQLWLDVYTYGWGIDGTY